MQLLRNFFYSTLNQLLLIIVPFITIPYVSRTLGAHQLGIHAYTSTIIAYYVLLANLSLSVYGTKLIAQSKGDKEKETVVFWEITLLKLLVTLLVYLVFLIFALWFKTYLIFLLLQSIALLETMIDFTWFLSGKEDFKKITNRNIIVKLLTIILVFLFVKKPSDLWIYILILSVSTFVGSLSIVPYVFRQVGRFESSILRPIKHIKPALIISVPQLLLIIHTLLAKLMLGYLGGVEQSAYFDNSDRLIKICLALMTSFGAVIFPKISYYYKQHDIKMVRFYTEFSLILISYLAIPLTAGLISISSVFSGVFFGENFDGIDLVLNILVLQLLFKGLASVLGQHYMIATNKSKLFSQSILIGLMVLGIGCFVLITKYGAVGAALASVISEVVIFTYQVYCLRRELTLSLLCKEIFKALCAGVLLLVSCMVVDYWLEHPIQTILTKLLIGGTVYLIVLWLSRPYLLKYYKLLMTKEA